MVNIFEEPIGPRATTKNLHLQMFFLLKTSQLMVNCWFGVPVVWIPGSHPPKNERACYKGGTLRIPWPTGAPNQQANHQRWTPGRSYQGEKLGYGGLGLGTSQRSRPMVTVVQWSLLPSTQGPLLQTPPGLEDVKRKELVCNPPRICLEDNFFLLDTWRIFFKHVICVWKLVSEN